MDYRKIIREMSTKGGMLDVLKALQEAEGYLSEDAMRAVASAYNRPVSEIYETATFYSMLKVQRAAKHEVQVCGSTCCDAKESAGLLVQLKSRYDKNPNVSIGRCECLGRCDTAPNVLVDGELISHATMEDVVNALEKAGE